MHKRTIASREDAREGEETRENATAATRTGDDDQKTPVETETTRDATTTNGRAVRPSDDGVEDDEDADYDASSIDEEDEDEEEDDDDDFHASTRGRSASVGAGAKIVDGKVVGTNAEASGGDEQAAKRVKMTAGGAIRADRSADDPTPALLEALREYVAKCGGQLSDDWTCTATMRTQGASAGTYDALYWSPDKERYRSRLEVVRALGLAPQKILKSSAAAKKPEHFKPLSREEAVKKAREAEQPTVPMDLGENLVVESFGQVLGDNDEFHDDVHIWPLGYKTIWKNDSGVTFTSEVTKASDNAPEFVVSTEKDGSTVSVCSASPLGAWLEMCETIGPMVSIGIHDHFSFDDVRVVRAIESLPGSDAAVKYQFVEEREGWFEERVRRSKSRLCDSKEILAKIREMTKKEKTEKSAQSRVEKSISKLIERLISRVDSAATRAKQREERLDAKRTLADMMKQHRDSLREAAKAEKEAAKEAAKMQKEAQREAEKVVREAAKAKAAIEREAQKEINKAKRAKEAEEKKKRDAERAKMMNELENKQKEWLVGMSERESDSADTTYSPPVMSPNLKIEPDFKEKSELGDIMEIWMFLDRFKRELFGSAADVKSPPTVQALARVLSNPKESEEFMASLHLALIAPCVADAAASVDKSSASALQLLPDAHSHISDTKGVWQELVRRFLYAASVIHDMPAYEPYLKDAPPILPEAADVFTRYMCSGDAGIDPLSYAEGAVWHGHAVEKYSARVSPALCALSDAEALAAAEIEMYALGSGVSDDSSSRVVESRRQKAKSAVAEAKSSQHIHAVRCALRNMACQHSMSQVCLRGDGAAVKGQHPRGLDIRLLDARLGAGVYAAAAHSTSNADEMDELIKADVLEAATNMASLTNGNGAKAKKELIAAVEGALKQTKAGSDELPKTPWDEGCSVCGLDVMAGTVLLCDSCDGEYHAKCLDPPLLAEPEGEWFCPTCVREKENNDAPNVSCCKSFEGTTLHKASTGEMIIARDAMMEKVDNAAEDAVYTGGCRGAFARRLRSLARDIDAVGFDGLSPQARVTLLRTLMTVALDSVALRTSIDNGVNLANETKKDIRQHIKAWSEYRLDREDGKGEARDAEEAKAAKEAKAAEEAKAKDETQPMDVDEAQASPAEEVKPEEKKEKKAKAPQQTKQQKVPTEEELAQARVRWQSKWHEVEVPQLQTAPRREPLGSDRHRQKYWALGNWGEVIVQAAKDNEHHDVEPEYGIMTLSETKVLIDNINPKGRKEGDLWRSLQRRYGADQAALKDVDALPSRPDDGEWATSGVSDDVEGISRVRSAFLTLESEIPDVAFNSVLGSETRRAMWRNLAGSAQTLSALAAAIIVFQRAIESDWLQPGWLPWSWMAPLLRCSHRSNEKSDARCLRLHLIALRRAFKWNKATRASDRLVNAAPDLELPRSSRARKATIVESDSDDEYESIFSDSDEVMPSKTTAENRRFRL